MFDGGLELRRDPGGVENRLDLLCLGHVLGQRHLHHPRHELSSPIGTASWAGTGCSRRLCSAPPLTRTGPPRSSNRSPMISKSLGTTVEGKTSRASRTTSGPK